MTDAPHDAPSTEPAAEEEHGWDGELAALRRRIGDLDGRFEELLAAGPVAPGVIEGLTEMGHETAQLVERLIDRARSGRGGH
jgi:hypothetical protein